MTSTLERPATLSCACPGCGCSVLPDTPHRVGSSLFCSEACAKGHPNGEPCCDRCDCHTHAG